MYQVKYLSPMIPSHNIGTTVSFFENLLGFQVGGNDNTYLILYKDQATVHIMRAGHDIGEMEFYLEVDDLETLWNHMKDKLDGIKVRAPFEQEYGMREFHIVIPETKTLLFIGQRII